MSLQDIVNVTITSAGRGVSRKGFGTALVIAKHNNFPELFRQYNLGTAPADMVADGFGTNDPAYRAVSALARNTPKSSKVIVGKLLSNFTHTFKITVKAITALGGELYEFDIVSPDGTVITTISYTASPGDTATVIALALQTQITAIVGLTATVLAGVITCTADNVNEMWLVNGLAITILDFEDTTVDSALVAELSAIHALNADWYGLILADPQSAARITALANYIETQEAIFLATTHDTATGNPVSTTDIAYTLNAAQLFRTALIYSGDQGQHAAATWMGALFPFDPGSETWAFKVLSGVAFDVLSSSFESALEGKRCNYYVEIAGAAVTRKDGTMASGEYIDVIRGRDWLTARMRERIFGLLINARKVPFTNAGIDMVTKEVTAQLREGIGAGYLSPDPLEGSDVPFIVTAPDVSEISKQDKIARHLPDVNFEAGLAGAIHSIKINGTIQV